ncbi:hypothetical protein HMPREF9141_0010 [Prevotella multiformis DSM 16608]|uniref:Uncharacterized protein n=1 Tax=Prevotella multiformis DSM 16608 TaxID=888743 RepID=F0F344_9BACT|nr:hypothetical protein HMPREF9141_0010 [Prevotella multiformis DSM 16608]
MGSGCPQALRREEAAGLCEDSNSVSPSPEAGKPFRLSPDAAQASPLLDTKTNRKQ